MLHSVCMFGLVIWCLPSDASDSGLPVLLVYSETALELVGIRWSVETPYWTQYFTGFFSWERLLGACAEDVFYVLVQLAAVARAVISRCKSTPEWEGFCWVTAVMQCSVSTFTSAVNPLAGIQDLSHGRHLSSLVQSAVLKDVWYLREETSGSLYQCCICIDLCKISLWTNTEFSSKT